MPDSCHTLTQFGHNWQIQLLIELIFAEIARIGSPLAVAGGNQICDDAADILLLRWIVVRSRVVSRYRHRPCLVAVVKVAQELCGIFHVAMRIEHFLHGAEVLAVKIVIDLHTSDVDELRTASAGGVELPQCGLLGGWKQSLPLDVHGIGIERSLAPGFRQPDRIENSLGNPVFGRCRLNFTLAGACGGRCARGKRCQSGYRQRRQQKRSQHRSRPHH